MRRTLTLLAIAVSAGLLSGPADARHDRDRDRGGNPPMQPEGWRDNRGDRSERRAEEAGRRAQQRNGGGRVLSVEPEGSGYRVKVLKEGEVRTHHVEDNN